MVERVRLADNGIAVEGQFAPPQLAQLGVDDQVFVAAFVRSHGSIKEMERIFGVSYPTIKCRLKRIAEALDFVDTDPAPAGADVVDRLRWGGDQRRGGAGRAGGAPVIPQLMTVGYRRSDGRRRRLYAPVLPLAVVLSPLLLLAVPAGLVACLVHRVSPVGALCATWRLLCALPGTRFELEQGPTAVLTNVR